MPSPTLQVQEFVPLVPFTTLGIGGAARYFLQAESEDVVAAGAGFALERGLPLFVLGGGSNLLVSDAGFDGVVMHAAMAGKAERPDGDDVLLTAGAGEDWNSIVLYAVEREYAGIECLAGIPGDAGGTPVQNVGAYGQEISATIENVRAYDLESLSFVDLDREACQFGYRRSLFNTEARGRYIVTGVTYRLRPGGEPTLGYADLQRHFNALLEHDKLPTLHQTYEAVRSIREQKGMLAGQGGADGHSAGSFFKNPVVEATQLPEIAHQAQIEDHDLPRYPAEDGYVKLPAAWLVERAGFHKGFAIGRAAISSRHTLALVNLGGATAVEVIALRDAVIAGVQEKFGVKLEQEPVLLGF